MKHRSRRVVQLGLKGQWLQSLGEGDAVVRIERLDDLLENQRAILSSDKPHLLAVPKASPLDVGFLKVGEKCGIYLLPVRSAEKAISLLPEDARICCWALERGVVKPRPYAIEYSAHA